MPGKASEMRAALAAWRKETGAVIPPGCAGYGNKTKRRKARGGKKK